MQKPSRTASHVLAAVVTVVLVAASASSSLAAVYAVDRVVGGGRITGTIETDGTLGVLTASDIVGWNLTIDADGNPATTGHLDAANSSITFLEAGPLSATATGLFFDFAAPGFSILQIATPTYDASWQLQGNVFSDELIREAIFPDVVQAFQQHPPALQLIAGSAEPSFTAALHVDQLRIHDDRGDRIRLHARFDLDPSSDGIDPATDEVMLELSTPLGTFYPNACAMAFPLLPGELERAPGGRGERWRLTEAGRARTGIERFEITDGAIVFVDRRTVLPSQSYARVRVELTIGNDHASADVTLMEHPAGSRRWRER